MAQSTARLPFAPPAWLTPRRVGTWALCLGMLVLNVSLHPEIFPRWEWDIGFFSALSLLLALSPLVWHLLLTRRGARSSDLASGLLMVLFIGMMAGLFVLLLWRGGAWFGFWAKIFSQYSWASPYGLGIGVIYVALLALVGQAEEDPSHDALDFVLLGAGLWLSLIGGAVVQLTGAGAPLLLGFLMLALGIGCVLWPLWRFGALVRWIDAVSSGKDPRWQILSREGVSASYASLLPLFFEEEAFYEKILVYCDGSRMGPYRGVEEKIPVAFLPRSFAKVLGATRKRSREALIVLLGQVVLLGVLVIQLLSFY